MDNMQNNFDETTILNPNPQPSVNNEAPFIPEPTFETEPQVSPEPEFVEVIDAVDAPKKKSSNVFAILSLVFGIVANVIACCGCLSYVSPLFSIAAIVFGIISPKNEFGKKNGMAIAGIIIGAVGIASFVIGLIIGGLGSILNMLGASADSGYYYY